MRCGEIRNLQWRDLDFDSGFIIIRDSKNGETRHVPMDSTVVELLSQLSPNAWIGFRIHQRSGRPIRMVAARFPEGVSARGTNRPPLPRSPPYICKSVDDGGRGTVCPARHSGSKTIAMTQRYAHLSPAYKRTMVDRMEQIWAKPASRPAEMPVIPENHRRLLQRHNHTTKTAVAVNP